MNSAVILSQEAEQDLSIIFDYTYEKFGADQALLFISSFDDDFLTIKNHPLIGKDRSELILGLRSYIKGQYIIFYRIIPNGIRIVRIIHQSRDLPFHLAP